RHLQGRLGVGVCDLAREGSGLLRGGLEGFVDLGQHQGAGHRSPASSPGTASSMNTLRKSLDELRQRLKAGFDPNEPRIPAGQEGGGEWTSGGGAGKTRTGKGGYSQVEGQEWGNEHYSEWAEGLSEVQREVLTQYGESSVGFNAPLRRGTSPKY